MSDPTCSANQVPPIGEYVATTPVALTPMQKKVLNLLSENLLNNQIAFALGITEATVKMHVSAILKKLGAKNRKEAGFYCKISGAVQACQVRVEA